MSKGHSKYIRIENTLQSEKKPACASKELYDIVFQKYAQFLLFQHDSNLKMYPYDIQDIYFFKRLKGT